MTAANYIAGSSTLVAGNIKKGVSILGVTGTFEGWVDNPLVLVDGTNTPFGCSSNLGNSISGKSYWIPGNDDAPYAWVGPFLTAGVTWTFTANCSWQLDGDERGNLVICYAKSNGGYSWTRNVYPVKNLATITGTFVISANSGNSRFAFCVENGWDTGTIWFSRITVQR